MSSLQIRNFKAVLFDFDGVLGNTMEDNYQAWLYALGLYGASFSKLEYFLAEGNRVSDIAADVLARHGKDPKYGPQVAQAKDTYYNQHNNFRFHEGVEEIIPKLKRNGIKLAVVSGAARMRLVTPKTETFLSSFDAVITADECKRGKPDPEPYLNAATKLGLEPGDCVVVENAPLGIESAKRAGMYCIAICSTLTEEYLTKADRIVKDFNALARVFF